MSDPRGTITQRGCFVPGTPAPQGSKRHVGRGRLIEQSKAVGPWRERIALHVHGCGWPLLTGPVSVRLQFVMPRPTSTPKRSTPPAIKRPDLDKLSRAVLDALTGVAIDDDSRVIDLRATKALAEIGQTPGVHITVIDLSSPLPASLHLHRSSTVDERPQTFAEFGRKVGAIAADSVAEALGVGDPATGA